MGRRKGQYKDGRPGPSRAVRHDPTIYAMAKAVAERTGRTIGAVMDRHTAAGLRREYERLTRGEG